MIRPGNIIINAYTGQEMITIKTGAATKGELLQIEYFSPPTSVKEPEHIHPLQENQFEILGGECTFSVNGKHMTVGAGQSITILQKCHTTFGIQGIRSLITSKRCG